MKEWKCAFFANKVAEKCLKFDREYLKENEDAERKIKSWEEDEGKERKKRRQHWYSIVLHWFLRKSEEKNNSIHSHKHTSMSAFFFLFHGSIE